MQALNKASKLLKSGDWDKHFIWFSDNSPLNNCSLDNHSLDNCPPENCPLPRTIAPWAISPNIPHLRLLCYPRIYTTWQLLPRTMTIQITTFSWLFSVFLPWPNYIISDFSYDNKNNNDNTNKTWKLKLLTVFIL